MKTSFSYAFLLGAFALLNCSKNNFVLESSKNHYKYSNNLDSSRSFELVKPEDLETKKSPNNSSKIDFTNNLSLIIGIGSRLQRYDTLVLKPSGELLFIYLDIRDNLSSLDLKNNPSQLKKYKRTKV